MFRLISSRAGLCCIFLLAMALGAYAGRSNVLADANASAQGEPAAQSDQLHGTQRLDLPPHVLDAVAPRSAELTDEETDALYRVLAHARDGDFAAQRASGRGNVARRRAELPDDPDRSAGRALARSVTAAFASLS
jgi:hypothetical protein